MSDISQNGGLPVDSMIPMAEKTLWIREPDLQQLLAGEKTVEIRVAYANIAKLRTGDHLLLNDQHPFEIQWISIYDSFDTLLANVEPGKIAPGVSRPELIQTLREIYPPDKEILGVVALHLTPVDRVSDKA